MRSSYLSAVIGILALAAVVLSGCALLSPEEISQPAGAKKSVAPTPWLIAAQGEGEPQVCREDFKPLAG